MKRLRADDSADSRVKVGHRQALHLNTPALHKSWGVCLWAIESPAGGAEIQLPLAHPSPVNQIGSLRRGTSLRCSIGSYVCLSPAPQRAAGHERLAVRRAARPPSLRGALCQDLLRYIAAHIP